MQKRENLEHKSLLQILKRWHQCLLVFVIAILTWEMFRQLWLKDSNNVSNRYGHKDVWWLSDKLCMCVLLHSIWYFSTQKEDNFQLTRRRRRWRGCGHFPLSCWKCEEPLYCMCHCAGCGWDPNGFWRRSLSYLEQSATGMVRNACLLLYMVKFVYDILHSLGGISIATHMACLAPRYIGVPKRFLSFTTFCFNHKVGIKKRNVFATDSPAHSRRFLQSKRLRCSC